MARQKKKVSLRDDDWNMLFPGEPYMIGRTELSIVPMDLKTLSEVLKKVGANLERLPSIGISAALEGTSNAATLNFVVSLIEEVPDILSEMSGLDAEDVTKLPIATCVDLFVKCVDVNLQAKESMLKNFKRLGEGLSQMTQDGPPSKKKKDLIGEALTKEAA